MDVTEAGVGTDVSLVALRRYAVWLDEGIKLPGVPWHVGLDPLLGLIPGLGDALGAAFSTWIFVAAIRRRATAPTLARIAANIIIDALVGMIPLLGDAFDFAWKANIRNVRLLERHQHDPVTARRADKRFIALLVFGMVASCGVTVIGGFVFLIELVKALVNR